MEYVLIGAVILLVLWFISKRSIRTLDKSKSNNSQIPVPTLVTPRVSHQGSTHYERLKDNSAAESQFRTQPENNSEEPEFSFMGAGPRRSSTRMLEYTNERGNPCFLYRFTAFPRCITDSKFLKLDGTEQYFERIGGNSDQIMEGNNGYWMRVSEFESPIPLELIARYDRYHYIGGRQVYMDFLLGLREIYETKDLSASEKRNSIKEYCDENHKVYLSDPGYMPPWEELLVPTLTQADGIGAAKVKLLADNGLKTVRDIDNSTDAQLDAIKGVGKATIGELRRLAAGWRFDKTTPIIERDQQYRKVVT